MSKWEQGELSKRARPAVSCRVSELEQQLAHAVASARVQQEEHETAMEALRDEIRSDCTGVSEQPRYYQCILPRAKAMDYPELLTYFQQPGVS